MEKDIPLTLEQLTAAEIEQCSISSVREIENILRHIVKSKTRIALYYGDKDSFIISTLLSADSSGLFVEQANKEFDNGNIEHSGHLTFVGVQAQVKIQFPITQIKRSEYQGTPAFQFMMPERLLRIQRREFFRVATPLVVPLLCTIIPHLPAVKRVTGFTIVNVSGGGLGLLCTKEEMSLQVGQTYQYQLNLPGVGNISGEIEVKSINNSNVEDFYYIGCEFKNLDRSTDLLLQRYITEVQRRK